MESQYHVLLTQDTRISLPTEISMAFRHGLPAVRLYNFRRLSGPDRIAFTTIYAEGPVRAVWQRWAQANAIAGLLTKVVDARSLGTQ